MPEIAVQHIADIPLPSPSTTPLPEYHTAAASLFPPTPGYASLSKAGIDSPELRTDIIRGLYARNIRPPDDRYNGPEDAANGSRWGEALDRIADHAVALGREKLQRVCQIAGYICLDRYEVNQVRRLSDIIEGQEKPPKDNLTLVLSDVYGDYTDMFAEEIPEYDTGSTFFGEYQTAMGIYRVPISLGRHGLHFSTLVNLTHGDIGFFGVGKITTGVGIGPEDAGQGFYDLDLTQSGRFIRKYLKPHTETGKRSVVMASCDSAQPNTERNRSVVESVARLTKPEDNVVVSGSQTIDSRVVRLNLTDPDDQDILSTLPDTLPKPNQQNIVVFWNDKADVPAPTQTYRYGADGTLQLNEEIAIPGL